MRITRTVLLLAALAAPATLRAQQPAGRTTSGHGMDANDDAPVAVTLIILHKDDLQLTGEQVSRIQEIEKRMAEKNRPLQEQVEGALTFADSTLTDVERKAKREEIAPVRAQLQANEAAALKEAEALLTPAQRARAEEMLAKAVKQKDVVRA